MRLVIRLIKTALQLFDVLVLEAEAAALCGRQIVVAEAAFKRHERARHVEGEAFQGPGEGHFL